MIDPKGLPLLLNNPIKHPHHEKNVVNEQPIILTKRNYTRWPLSRKLSRMQQPSHGAFFFTSGGHEMKRTGGCRGHVYQAGVPRGNLGTAGFYTDSYSVRVPGEYMCGQTADRAFEMHKRQLTSRVKQRGCLLAEGVA